MPAGVDVSPVDETETYCIESGGAIDTAWKVKKDGTGCKQVFENHETTQDFNLLTCGLDQGSSGAAGMAYIMFALDMLAWVSFDKIHRLVRDLKGSVLHAAGGVFLKAQLYSNHIWSVNFRPWGTGLFASVKKRWLNLAMRLLDHRDEIFWSKYGPLMAQQWNMDFDTDEAKELVWKKIPIKLVSFIKALNCPKMGRWCSWNQSAKEQIPEFYAQKMIYEWACRRKYLTDPDSAQLAFDDLKKAAKARHCREQLDLLKKTNGGFELCYKLMHSKVREYSQILYVIQHSSWCWYTDKVKYCKSPSHHLQYLHAMSTQWCKQRHLTAMVQETLYTGENLDSMGFHVGDCSEEKKKIMGNTANLLLHLLGQRGWSLSRHTAPPEAYVDIMCDLGVRGLRHPSPLPGGS